MPYTAKQGKFMGADLARARAGQKTKTGMNEAELEKYMEHGKHKKKAMKSNMPKGASQSPSGDIGAKRQEESAKMGGFKAGSTVTTAGKF